MRQKIQPLCVGGNFKKLDIFGHQIGVTYKGENFYKTNIGAIFSILMAFCTIVYAVVQTQEFVLVKNPDVISLESKTNLRDSEAFYFSENQFNFAFEFVEFKKSFEELEVPAGIASLKALAVTEVATGDGSFNITE